MADSCLMQRSIMVSFRKVPLNDKNRPGAVILFGKHTRAAHNALPLDDPF